MKCVFYKLMKSYPVWIMFLLLLSCGEKISNSGNNKDKKELPDQQGWNSTLTLSKEGVKTAVIKYGHLMKFTNRKMVYFDEGVELELFKEDGTLKTHLTSDKGELNEATKDMVAIGDVVVVDSTRTLRTERLTYSAKTKKIDSEMPVMMWSAEGDTVYGDGFEMEQMSDEIIIKNPSGKFSKGIDFKSAQRKFSNRKAIADSASSTPDSLISNDSLKTKQAIL